MSAVFSFTDLLELICDYLSTPQEILLCLSHLNRSVAQELTADCFHTRSLVIPHYTQLGALLNRLTRRRERSSSARSAQHSSRARLGAVDSLVLALPPSSTEESKTRDGALVKLFELRSVSSPSLFLFSSLSHLSIRCHTPSPLRLTRQALFRLLSSASGSLTSLTSLEAGFNDSSADRTPVSLTGLTSLRQVRLAGSFCHVSALGGVLNSLWSLPHLESLDLSQLTVSGAETEHATMAALLHHPPPPSSAIRHLWLPLFNLNTADHALTPQMNEWVDALATCRLQMLAAKLPLSVRCMTTLLSLPSLRILDLASCWMSTSHMCQLLEPLSNVRDSQPSLINLRLPILYLDSTTDAQGVMDRYAALLPQFVARHKELRHFGASSMPASDADYLQVSIQPLQQLQTIRITGIGALAANAELNLQLTSILELHSPLSCPNMLRIELDYMHLEDEWMSVLLAASPQLLWLVIRNCALDSWNLFCMAALHCPQLRHCEVSGHVAESHSRRRPAVTAPTARPHISPPLVFLPHLAYLSVCEQLMNGMAGVPFSFANLQPLIHPDNRSLLSAELIGSALTAAFIHSLSVLPSLLRLAVSNEEVRVTLPEVQWALQDIDSRRPTARQKRDFASLQRQIFRDESQRSRSRCNRHRALFDALDTGQVADGLVRDCHHRAVYCTSNLLYVDGIDVAANRPVFFQALQAQIGRSSHAGTRTGRLQAQDEEDGEEGADEDGFDDDEEYHGDIYFDGTEEEAEYAYQRALWRAGDAYELEEEDDEDEDEAGGRAGMWAARPQRPVSLHLVQHIQQAVQAEVERFEAMDRNEARRGEQGRGRRAGRGGGRSGGRGRR